MSDTASPTMFGLFRRPAPSNLYRLITKANKSQRVVTFGSMIINILQLYQCCSADKLIGGKTKCYNEVYPSKNTANKINKQNGKHIQGRRGHLLR